MALRDLLEQHGVAVEDPAAVFSLLRRLPLAVRSKVELWTEYQVARGSTVTQAERDALQS